MFSKLRKSFSEWNDCDASDDTASIDTFFLYLAKRRKEGMDTIHRLTALFQLSFEVYADISKKFYLKEFQASLLKTSDVPLQTSFNELGNFLKERNKTYGKLAVELKDQIYKPLKLFLKKYKFESLKILHKMRKIQAKLGHEYRKALRLKVAAASPNSEANLLTAAAAAGGASSFPAATSLSDSAEASNSASIFDGHEKYSIQMEKCEALLNSSQSTYQKLIGEFKELEVLRIGRIKVFMWTFQEMYVQTTIPDSINILKKSVLTIDPDEVCADIDAHHQPLSYQAIEKINESHASIFYISSLLKEMQYI